MRSEWDPHDRVSALKRRDSRDLACSLSVHTLRERPYELTYSKKAAIDKARREVSFGSDHAAP